MKLSDDAAYRAAQVKLDELVAKRTDLQKSIRGYETAIEGRQELTQLDRAARAMLGDTDAEFASLETSRQKRHIAAADMLVIDRAIAMQRDAVAAERARVSEAICQELLPAHKANVAKIAKALTALHKAVAEEYQLRERLTDADISFSSTLRPMPLVAHNVRTADELAELAERYTAEARAYGLL